MTYARARLWLGISGVGFLVVVAGVGLWFDLPHRLLRGVSGAAAIALILGCYVVLSLPSDILGGYVLPRRHGRASLSLGAFWAAWARGVAAQAFVVGLSAGAILEAARWGGTWGGVACFAGLMVVLLLAQLPVARLVGGLRLVDAGGGNNRGSAVADSLVQVLDSAFILQSNDPGFVGGWVGLPGRERLVVPSAWLGELAPGVLDVERVRREGVLVTGARLRGVAVAYGWNLVGFVLASRVPGSSLGDAPGLVHAALCFTLWSFAGLLLLPSLNRPGVFEADRFALDAGIGAEALEAAVSALDRLQDDEPARSRWVERVFHPIPSVESRVALFDGAGRPRGAWQGARMALYLSWACFGFLSRAVHCNAGRPELWVLFPGD